ncbi:DEAD/DEAH box helicase [Sphingomonas nostoxanthinifaciens]|uniref:DEAD/DEAH box helicase n=1 Tax=Sphingomonas nostoxanthinifaciens TaxID=2872652 RepID=UPI001CC1EC59|nr:DEAD/DEAH box helicase [Sphingomonas nostoxanthinifaciens]UAK24042.1 DEAD/DEAH box helicase [Sphingomonas nostoxanthinifaciens]
MIWGRRPPKDPTDRPAEPICAAVTDDGLAFRAAATSAPAAAAATALLDQLTDEGLAEHGTDGHLIRWPQLYVMLDDPEAAREMAILGLPGTIAATPRLASRGSLTDEGFAVAIDGWVDGERKSIPGARLNHGALELGGTAHLLAPPVWDLVERVRNFARRGEDARNEAAQRRSWGEIRQSALAAGAMLDDFLYRTVVLTPDKLQLALRRSGDQRLVEVEPWFEGAPTHWLEAYDKSASVRERYDLTTPEGVIQVMIAPEVGTVLREIKRMPGRRLAGKRAEAFLLNPTAAIGPDAARVIDADQFEAAKEQAGIVFDRFAAMTPETHGPGTLGLLITSGTGDAPETRALALDEDDVREFTDRVLSHLDRNLQLCAWDDYEFELDGDSRLHCEALLRALGQRSEGLITYGEIYDLAGYSDRVDGIGHDKAFYSPHFAKRKEGEGWFPKNLVPMIGWTDPASNEPVVMPLTDELSEELRTGVDIARERGSDTVPLTGCPSDIPLGEALAIVSAFANARREASAGTFKPPTSAKRGKRPTLILKGNIDQIDYREERLAALATPPASARLPSALRPEVSLKEHQLEGLAWMQHLLALAPDQCRGALLADDMGLGKTLQILCLISRAREEDPTTPPALVIAPLSLLENWREEADKFLEPGTLRILTAYGDGLSELRVDKSAVDEQLRREGLVRFLRPDWRGDADVVLTTYETLRDLEFSFARERWSVMVCDEAQKIKNPNAAMTKAAKKQKAAFRIACTGTPVENSLVDLWCLFDFVQPGLLGALNEFGSSYRRPIEAEGEEDRAKIEELRGIIAPQLLRRMKVDVATDLKDKIVDGASRNLPMSGFQRGLYVGAIERFRKQAASAGHLALLHRLRLLCSEPSGNGAIETFDPIDTYRSRSPKLDWLIEELGSIRDLQEKAIVFCEFKAIQRLIRHYVREAFGITPDIINGDTSAVASSIDSRQKRIRKFQEQPGFGIIVLSPVAVGFGVNMQAANHVIHFTRTWNPAKEDQATDRAYRIGQTKDVFVYYPTVSAEDFKTFDVKLDELLERKRALAGDMLNGSSDIGLRDFDMDELQP